jgi:REP element-mobilizing transposase RayT
MSSDLPQKIAPPHPNRLVSGFHSRGALPHLKQEGATYFVTFRLNDTLPRKVLLQLKQERERILQRTELEGRTLTWQERKELFHWYAERVDGYLDQGQGECWLRRPEVARLVVDALRHFEGQRYSLHAWVVMPNHVHVVVRPEPQRTLSEILKSWKGYTSVQSNRLLGREGEKFWQSESYDHCCRDEEDFARCCAYAVHNPVNAGLCKCLEEWPWSSAYKGSVVGQVSDLPVLGVSDSLRTGLQSRPEPSGLRPDPRRGADWP